MESKDSQQKDSEEKGADSAARANSVEAEVYNKVPLSLGGASLGGEPPTTTEPLGDSFLDHTLLGPQQQQQQQQQQHTTYNNKVSQSQATPTIPLATPTTTTSNIISNSSNNSTASPATSSKWLSRNFYHSLVHRCTQADPSAYLPGLKRQLYGLPSMVQRLALERQLEAHQGCVNCINFSWAGHLLASGSDDLKVVLWDWASGKAVRKFDSGHVANVFQVRGAWRREGEGGRGRGEGERGGGGEGRGGGEEEEEEEEGRGEEERDLCVVWFQAKFMPHSEDSVLVTAARDGQVKCHVLTSTGELHHSKRVGHHNDSAHKVTESWWYPWVYVFILVLCSFLFSQSPLTCC